MPSLLLTEHQNTLLAQTLVNIKDNEANFDMINFVKIPEIDYPGRFRYNHCKDIESLPAIEEIHACNTSMCFAGWLVYTHYQNTKETLPVVDTWEFAKAALLVLGYSKEEADTTMSYYRTVSWEEDYRIDSVNLLEHGSIPLRFMCIFYDILGIRNVSQLEEKLKLAELI